MPNRDFSIAGYRYGFNGKENDDEVKGAGNSLDFGARIYDSRLGRWIAIDPQNSETPGWSPYHYALNSPVRLTDEQGELPIIPLLLKAGANAAADYLLQVGMEMYFGGKTYEEVDVNEWSVTASFFEGLIPWRTPGGRLGRAALSGANDVLAGYWDAYSNDREYTEDQAWKDFMLGMLSDLAGGGLGELVSRYGAPAVAKGIKNLGIDYSTVRKWMGGGIKQVTTQSGGIVSTRMAQGWSSKVAVIGRNMDDRVKKFADGIGAEVFSPTQKALEMAKKGDSSLLMQENKAWVKKLQDEGYTVYDTGLDPNWVKKGNTSKGEFYEMETKELFTE